MRIAVVGTSGVGKTVFSRELAGRLDADTIELDALHWGPAWTARPPSTFRELVADAVAAECWVCDGNYAVVRDLVWRRATTIVWLDFRFGTVFGRAISRSLHRVWTGETLYAGNQERWTQVFDPEWIPWWVLRTFQENRRLYGSLFECPMYRHLRRLRLRTPAAALDYIESVPSNEVG